MSERAEIVIVGGGVAGGAAAASLAGRGFDVLLLERQDSFRDLGRGEWLAPWGVRESHLLGLADTLVVAGAWEIREWVQWDEVVEPEQARAVDMTRFIPGVGGPLSFRHHLACRHMCELATGRGARVVMGASRVRVQAGQRPSVRYVGPDGPCEVRPRLVLGAAGRAGVVGRQVGIPMTTELHHWGAGLAVSGVDDWPADVQAMGSERDVNFMVFPQGFGTARLYLNFATADHRRYQGPDGVRRFLDAFRLTCLPGSDIIVGATPDSPLVAWPSVATFPDRDPVVEGVVLMGDEAGVCDSIIGGGLSSALRDVRVIGDLLESTSDWSPPLFASYCAERKVRIARLQHGARIIGQLNVEFGPAAVERRRRARRIMADNPAAEVVGLLSLIAPEDVPEFSFNEFLFDRLTASAAR